MTNTDVGLGTHPGDRTRIRSALSSASSEHGPKRPAFRNDHFFVLPDKQFPGAIEIVDIYHAKQHLCDVAKAVYGAGTELADAWAKDRHAELDAGRLRALVAALRSHAKTTLEARKCIHYVFGNRHRMRYPQFRARGLTPLYVKNARGSTTARSVRGELKALASLGSRSPRTVNHGRQPAARVLRCAPALRVTAAADRAGSPCAPAGRLALDPLPGSATPASHSVVAENRRQTPEWDRVHLPDRGFAVARTIRKHAVGILAYLDTRMTERARGRTHPARPTG